MMEIKRPDGTAPVSIAPLVTFRISFGLLMLFSILRFWWRGWIDTVYVTPSYHFTYWGFEWIHPMGATGMYLLFAGIVLSTILIAIGLWYRIAAVFFFLGFTYVELMDVTTYLNHYYFISLVAFIMIWLPANRAYAVDVWRKPASNRLLVPAWCIWMLQFQMAVVYVFAGLAKVNTDWLLNAQPMRIWLPAKSHLPIIGKYMYETWVAYLFSWFGALYDLLIVFFLLNRKTRPVAYVFVLVFHIATAMFFPAIGMFPFVMIISSLIFFSGRFHERLLSYLPGGGIRVRSEPAVYHFRQSRWWGAGIACYVFFQLFVPLRFLFYPDRLFWNEEGYRFSWRVMLMEKSGAAYFTVKDKAMNQSVVVQNAALLTPLQEKMMSTQPDLILQYAHHLAAIYQQKGMIDPEVYGEVYVSLNGQRSRLFIDSTVNLAKQPLSWKHYTWVLCYKL